MDKNSIKSAVTGIEFTEESKQRIFDGIERRKNLKQKIHIKETETMKKRVVSWLLVVLMLTSLLPTSVLAEMVDAAASAAVEQPLTEDAAVPEEPEEPSEEPDETAEPEQPTEPEQEQTVQQTERRTLQPELPR